MNNRGYFNNNNNSFKEKVKTFFKDSGFYVVVVLGLCIIAAAAVYFTTNNITPEEETETKPEITSQNNENRVVDLTNTGQLALNKDEGKNTEDLQKNDEIKDNKPSSDALENQNSSNDNELTTSIIGSNEKETETPSPEPENNQETQKELKTTASTDETQIKPEQNSQDNNDKEVENEDKSVETGLFDKKPDFKWPINGEIITEYAMDKLIYSKTLDEWRTHSGIDIAGVRGTVVQAVADGVISEIKNDPRYGFTIVINHGNGYKTLYANLAESDMVSPNQKIKKGDSIGSVGNTAVFECVEREHLHFEVYKNDKLVDPSKYLPQE